MSLGGAPHGGEGLRRSYELLGDLFDQGFVPEVVGRLQEAGLDVLPEADPSAPALAEDEARARHESLFGFAVPPFAGVFLGADRQVGGEEQRVLAMAWGETGRQAPVSQLSADHLGSVARLFGALTGAVASPAMVESSRQPGVVLRSVITEHALGWLPALHCAVEREGASDYAEAIEVLIELALMQIGTESDPPRTGSEPSAFPQKLVADKDPPLGDNRAGVRELSSYLTTHAYTGFYVGRSTIGRLGRSLHVPRGFGGTDLMLTNLFLGASRFGELEGLIDGLEDLTNHHEAAWQFWSGRHPVLAEWADLWLSRLARSRSALREVSVACAREEADPVQSDRI